MPPTSASIHLATPPKTRDHLRRWLITALALHLPESPSCPAHNSPLDYLAHAFFEPADQPADAAVWACRGGGKTMLGAVATLLDLLFKPGIQIRILGGSLEQSDKMYTYLKALFYENFPDSLSRPPTRRRLALKNGSVAEILAQSDRSVRGTRVQKLRCDEVELFDPNVWKAAQLTTRSLPRVPCSGFGAPKHADQTNPLESSAASPDQPPIRGSIEALSTMHLPNGLMQKILAESPPNVCHAQGSGPLSMFVKDNPSTLQEHSPRTPTPLTPSPRKTFTWCLWDIIAKCHGNRKCATCPLWSDCQGRAKSANGFLPVADAISMHARVSRSTWEHEMLCHPPVREDAIFPAFRRTSHVRPWPLPRQAHTSEPILFPDRSLSAESLIAGIDFGYKGPFVCLWIQTLRDPAGRRVAWVLDELVSHQRTLPNNITLLKSQTPQQVTPMSPSAVCHAQGSGPLSMFVKDNPSTPQEHPPRTPSPHSSFNIYHSSFPPDPSSPAFWRPAILYCDPAGRTTNSHTARTDISLLQAAGFKVKSRPMGIADGIALLNELIDPASSESPQVEPMSPSAPPPNVCHAQGSGPLSMFVKPNPSNPQEPPPRTPAPISHLSFNIRHSFAPRLLIDPRCTHLITALENYHRLPNGDIHKDGTHDHLIDALRYALLNHDTRPTKLETRNY